MATRASGWVSESRLRELLAQQGEGFDLDYKRILDIQNDQRHRLKLVKTVAAMTARAGDVVIGVDPHGRPTGLVTAGLAAVFDEANLSPILRAFLPPELRVHSQTHDIDGSLVLIVHVEPGEGGPLALIADGVYTTRRGRQFYAFRAGERYIRDGTRNVLWTGDEHQVALLFNRQADAPPPIDPATVMSFDSSLDDLAAAAEALLAANNPIALRGLLVAAPERVRNAATTRDWAAVGHLLDRLVVLASVYLAMRANEQFDEVLEALQRIYEIGFEESEIQRQTTDAWSPRFLLEVAARVEIIGALALRLRRWEVVSAIAQWQSHLANDAYASWIRLAMTGRRFESWPRVDHRPKSVPEVAAEIAVMLPRTAADVGGDQVRVRASIGQFDLSVYFASVAKFGTVSQQMLMLDAPRVAGREPLVDFVTENLLEPGPARAAIFPAGDDLLVNALQSIQNAWEGDGFVTMHWYGPVRDFIRKVVEGASG